MTKTRSSYGDIGVKYLVTIALFMFAQAGLGLSTDQDQPATVEADEVEYDFRTGTRTYKGNVIVVQGSLRITGDKLLVQYENNEMKLATVWGNLASFQQRPDDKPEDVVGRGKKILYDQVKNTLTLMDAASLQQGTDVANGDKIVYDITADKLSVKGLASQEGGTEKAAGEETDPATKPGRVKITITPEQTSTAQ